MFTEVVKNSMRVALVLSQKSFRRAIRGKIFIVFLLFAIIMIFASLLFESLTFTAKLKIIKDVGLTGISIFSGLICIFLSGEAIVGEVERKNVYILFSKPVSKASFIIGSFLGIVWTTLLALLISGIAFLMLVYLKQGYIEPQLLLTIGFSGMEIIVITSIGVMFSSFSSSATVATLLCFSVYILGHLNPQLALLARSIHNKSIKELISITRFVLPNLDYFNLREKIARGYHIDPFTTGKIIIYTFIYSGIMLTLAYLFFRKREL
ncbi:ABC transporter permease subunit [Candidatus Aerophobetes bacterium]|nr:ABC transporter permease subunit [Candidatus Aerophobetes bacterium]